MLSLKDRLSEILINNKLISQSQLDQALNFQAEKGESLSDIIVTLKFLEFEQLSDALNNGLSAPLFDLKHFEVDPAAIRIVSFNTACRYRFIPLSKSADSISLAISDPLDIFAIENLPEFRGVKINPLIFPLKDIQQAIDLYYPAVFKQHIDELLKESKLPIEIIRPERNVFFNARDIERISRQAPVIKIVNTLLEEIVKSEATDALVELSERKLRVRFRIDGLFKSQGAFPKDMHASIIARLKVIADLDITKYGLTQDGRFKAQVFGRQVDFDISILPCFEGEKACLRVSNKKQEGLDIQGLGLSDYALGVLAKVSRLNHGLVLVCGPQASGKTTTLYAILKSLNSLDKNIVTIEDPVELQLEGINQVTVKPGIGLTFAAGMRSILLQDPNVIMIGEIRGYDTMDMAVKSALSGHLVFSALKAPTVSAALSRLLQMGVEPYLINSSLVCLAAQRLLRKVCPHCKESYVPKKELIESLKINPQKIVKTRFFKARGCPRCFNTGYSGTAMIAEVLEISQKMRSLILSNADEALLRQQACSDGMQSLRQAGLDAVLKGQTTIEEALRVCAPEP